MVTTTHPCPFFEMEMGAPNQCLGLQGHVGLHAGSRSMLRRMSAYHMRVRRIWWFAINLLPQINQHPFLSLACPKCEAQCAITEVTFEDTLSREDADDRFWYYYMGEVEPIGHSDRPDDISAWCEDCSITFAYAGDEVRVIVPIVVETQSLLTVLDKIFSGDLEVSQGGVEHG